MGEAKRKAQHRTRLDRSETVSVLNVSTNRHETFESRQAGSAWEFYRNHKPGPADVPCNGCTACCHLHVVEVDPSVEPPERLAELDLVAAEDGTTVLRRGEDGACIHLGPEGCTVYDNRPTVCRTFDCRMYALCGIVLTFGGGKSMPAWNFSRTTYHDRVLIAALSHGIAEYVRDATVGLEEVAIPATLHAFNSVNRLWLYAAEVISDFDSLSPDEQHELVDEALGKLAKRS